MFDQDSVKRLDDKSPLHAIQIELQHGYALSPVESQVLAHRLQQLVDEQTGYTRGLGQITYQAIDVNEPAGKSLDACRKVAVTEMPGNRANGYCYGAGGLIRYDFAEISNTAGVERFEEAQATRADVLMTSCPACLVQFQQTRSVLRSRMKIMDITQIIWEQILLPGES